MAKNRMTFEKTQRERKKKQKADEKRALRKKKKEQTQIESDAPVEPASMDDLE